MLALGVEVVDSVAVGQYDALIAPLVAQDILKQALRRAARLTLIAVVGAHHLLDITVNHQGLEGRKISLPEIPHRNGCVKGMAQRLRTAVDGIVLCAGVGLEILVIVALHTEDGLKAQHRGQIRVLTVGLLAAAPPRVTEDVDIRTPEAQFRVARIIGHTHRNVEDIVV